MRNNVHSEYQQEYECYLDGLAEGRKEGYEQGILKDCIKVACSNCKPSADNYCIDCEYANLIIDKDNQIYKLKKEITELKAHCKDVDEVNVKLRNCHNCNNWNWKHNKCEKKLKGDCFKQSKWELTE